MTKKLRLLMTALMLMGSTIKIPTSATAESCPDLKIVFVRGSGGERWTNEDYRTFKAEVEEKLPSGISYDFIDLDYPAIGIDDISVAAGAFFGAGEAYEFGASVNAGADELKRVVNSDSCASTKYVLGGYSQGAMVISKTLGSLNADKIIYAATFGDPKIYLPEGQGLVPVACSGRELSNYRMYVPDCRAYEGLLGSYRPYQPEAYVDKLGTWCNKYDIFCSSHFSISSHTSYVADDLYEDASRVIASKVANAFGIKNEYTSPHDTAILIDSTGSMASMINKYKAEALRLATETFEAGGRVALYDYRDLSDPYHPVARCDFETCSLDTFQSELNKIQAGGGGDTKESLLSASFTVMKELKWKQGSTKSLVILTDAGYLSPDRDGITYKEVIELSKTIDPVNFYIITKSSEASNYTGLAEDTDGKVVTNLDELSLVTDYIMERYDTLPRVEEDDATIEEDFVNIVSVEQTGRAEVVVDFEASGEKVLVILNDAVLGVTEENQITLGGLRAEQKNVLRLVPMSGERRGAGAEIKIELDAEGFGETDENDDEVDDETNGDEHNKTDESDKNERDECDAISEVVIPKAPNTGRHI